MDQFLKYIILSTFFIVFLLIIINKIKNVKYYKKQALSMTEKYYSTSRDLDAKKIPKDKKLKIINREIYDVTLEIVASLVRMENSQEKINKKLAKFELQIREDLYAKLIILSIIQCEVAENKNFGDIEVKKFKNKKYIINSKNLLNECNVLPLKSKYDFYQDIKEDKIKNLEKDLKIIDNIVNKKIKEQEKTINKLMKV